MQGTLNTVLDFPEPTADAAAEAALAGQDNGAAGALAMDESGFLVEGPVAKQGSSKGLAQLTQEEKQAKLEELKQANKDKKEKLTSRAGSSREMDKDEKASKLEERKKALAEKRKQMAAAKEAV